ncbi:MAG: tRNA (N6-isopentenyl adenosine(37)-C2)-methylthiotransferase MiaB [Clostridia bacterium]|nr:tRNA (N6-isopentenyl adenosine(37)-C2)-methylthiotransferase MiaB [Clostridia bacterium]
MKYFIKTFGCQMNEHDSEIIAGLLEADGYKLAENLEDAQIIITNTCCVRESAENHIWGFLGSLKRLKTANPNIVLAVCGCMAQQDNMAEKIRAKAKHMDIIIGTFQQHRLPEYIAEVIGGNTPIIDVMGANEDLPNTLPVARQGKNKAQINIIYGCNNYCSYCIVPYVRGPERSRPPEAIIAEVEDLAEAGYKEIMLLGQNVNSYGKDLPGVMDFAGLLVCLNQIKGIERIRYMTSHPRDFDRKLVDVIKDRPKICPHFHLPIQSGSDKILTLMNRGYDTAFYYDLLQYIKTEMPHASITTDLIVGFPGETEKDFAEGLSFIEKCRFDVAYTFLYSKRSGTPAATMENQVEMAERKLRLQRLMDIQNPISLQINKNLIGKNLKVLVEGVSKTSSDTYTGRTDTNKVVIFNGREDLVGSIVDVQITQAKTWHLIGKLL